MRKIRFAALFAFAALAASPWTARADINRATEWQDVPPGATVGDVLLDAGVSEEITNAVLAAIFDPANTNLAASAGKDFLDAADGEDENAAIAIGHNASAAVTDEAITNAPGAVTHLRSAGVAIGPYAEVRNDSQPWKVQGVAIGWHAQATEINTLAIGAGAQHTNETATTGNATVAAAPQANAFGYGAKATGFRATQIGQGVNSTSNSLQFLDVPVVRDGRLAVDEAGIVNAASNAIVNAGFAKGSYYETNTYAQTTVSWETDDENGRLQIRKIRDDTDPVALQWTMGTNQTVEIYGKQSIDSMTNALDTAIRAYTGSALSATNDFLRLDGGKINGDFWFLNLVCFDDLGYYDFYDQPSLSLHEAGYANKDDIDYCATEYCYNQITHRPKGSSEYLCYTFPSEDGTFALTSDIPPAVTNIVRDLSLGGIWDKTLEVWWTPVMDNGLLTYVATTNVDLSAMH